MSWIKEFRDFALKGNVIDLSVGVVIGAAFSKIVSSLVENIFMPLIGILLKGIDFTSKKLQVGDATLKYGMFIQSVIDFVIVAFCIFLFIKAISKWKSKLDAAASGPTTTEKLLTEIRDSLKK